MGPSCAQVPLFTLYNLYMHVLELSGWLPEVRTCCLFIIFGFHSYLVAIYFKIIHLDLLCKHTEKHMVRTYPAGRRIDFPPTSIRFLSGRVGSRWLRSISKQKAGRRFILFCFVNEAKQKFFQKQMIFMVGWS